MISELAGADFMINSVESKMLWWHFNSDSTDLKGLEPGSCGQAHKLHDNVDPTQRGDLLIFISLAYLGIDLLHHAGIDFVTALWGMAEQCGWYEWVEGAFEPLSGPAFLKPQKSVFNRVTAPLKMRLPGMDNSIPKGPIRYIQPELTNEKQEWNLSVYFGVNIDLQLLLAWAYGVMDREATTGILYL